MSNKPKNEGEKLVEALDKVKTNRRKEAFRQSTPVLVVKGFWIFAEGTAQLGMALFAIYQGRYGNFPVWGAYALTIAGVLVLVPAALLLANFFRQAAKD